MTKESTVVHLAALFFDRHEDEMRWRLEELLARAYEAGYIAGANNGLNTKAWSNDDNRR